MALLWTATNELVSTAWDRLIVGPRCASWSYTQEALVRILRVVNATGTVEQLRANMPETKPEAGCTSEPVAADAGCPVPCEWVHVTGQPTTAATGAKVIVYLHGGAFVAGSAATHRQLASRIAVATEARVLLVNYRLAPEFTFPAAMDDTLAVYSWLVASQGYNGAKSVAFMGDSAGGGIALSAAVKLNEDLKAAVDQALPLPACVMLLSPSVDLARSVPVVDNGLDILVPVRSGFDARLMFAGSDEATKNPLVSPILADLRGLCPLLIHCGSIELFRAPNAAIADKARQAGVTVEYSEYPDVPHVFQSLQVIFPSQAAASLQAIGLFAKAHLSG